MCLIYLTYWYPITNVFLHDQTIVEYISRTGQNLKCTNSVLNTISIWLIWFREPFLFITFVGCQVSFGFIINKGGIVIVVIIGVFVSLLFLRRLFGGTLCPLGTIAFSRILCVLKIFFVLRVLAVTLKTIFAFWSIVTSWWIDSVLKKSTSNNLLLANQDNIRKDAIKHKLSYSNYFGSADQLYCHRVYCDIISGQPCHWAPPPYFVHICLSEICINLFKKKQNTFLYLLWLFSG